jgi:hypothetical protein
MLIVFTSCIHVFVAIYLGNASIRPLEYQLCYSSVRSFVRPSKSSVKTTFATRVAGGVLYI